MGSKVQGSGFKGSGFMGSGFRTQGSRFRVKAITRIADSTVFGYEFRTEGNPDEAC
jgi:hypothetical protein